MCRGKVLSGKRFVDETSFGENVRLFRTFCVCVFMMLPYGLIFLLVHLTE